MTDRKRAGGVLRTVRRVWLIVRALFSLLGQVLRHDLDTVVKNTRLFAGLAMTVIGLLSFQSDRYCDGNTATYYACTRSATYYYYPWWAALLVVVGVSLVTVWFLRRRG